MNETGPSIRSISDTAHWAAVYRARESDRPDALFRDPLARRLSGERGEQIATTLSFGDRQTWTWTVRTYLFDQFITEQIDEGVDMVVNLAAGLDARPYRMDLPASLKWVEVDLPGILDYKEEVLEDETPVCALERIRLDLADISARRETFERLGREAERVLTLAEGLVVYLTADEVRSLARDLATPPGFRRWALDLASPGLLRMLQKKMGSKLSEGGAELKFGPEEGPDFFAPHGWKPVDVRSFLKTAARLKRLPLWMWLLALLPDSAGPRGQRPWAGVCLFAKK